MKQILLVTASLLALSATAASAADLAARPYTKAPPPMVATVYDWTGFYIGINGGWAQSHDNRSFDGIGSVGSYDANGGTVGGQIGYRWQNGGWVFGLEAQGNWADLTGSTSNRAVLGNVVSSKTDAFGLFTGQLGYAWNNVLLYAKGGAAVTDRNYRFSDNLGLVGQTGYDTRWSPTVGVGLEFAFSQGWSLGVEYNHIFEDTHNATFVGAGNTAIVARTGGDTDMVLGRLNYKFGGPMISRY